MAKLIYSQQAWSTLKSNTTYNFGSSSSDYAKSLLITSDGYLVTHGLAFRIGSSSASTLLSTITSGNSKNIVVTQSGDTASINLATTGATAGTYGSTTTIPSITVDSYGRITSVSSVTPTLNNVKVSAASNSKTYYIAGATGAADNTTLYESGKLYFTTDASGNVSFVLNGTTNTGVTSDIASNSSSTTLVPSTSGVATYVANQISSKLASNDAMLFVGTINGTGVIQSHNSSVVTATDDTTNISALTGYSAGWTFKVTASGTISGVGTVESGDMVICIKDYASAYSASDWTVVQANIDGAVTASAALTASQLVIGSSGSKDVKTLAAGTNGYFLSMVSGVPTWVANPNSNTWRPINLNGTAILTNSTSSGTLNFVTGDGISLSNSSGSLTIAGNYAAGTGLSSSTSSGKITFSLVNAKTDTIGGIKVGAIATSAVTYTTSTSGVNNCKVNLDPNYLAYVSVPNTSLAALSVNTSQSNGNVALTFKNNAGSSNSIKIKGDGTYTTVTTDSSGVITVTGSNSWRTVNAYTTAMSSASSIGTSTLTFAKDFVWSNSELSLTWGEIDSTGAITYTA